MTSVLAGATILLLVIASRRSARPSLSCTLVGIGFCALFLFSSQLVGSVVHFSGAFPPHIPLTLAAIELYPTSRCDTRRFPRLAAAMFLAGAASDRLPFIWTGVVLLVWAAVGSAGSLRRKCLLVAAFFLVIGAVCAQYLWRADPVLGLAVGTKAPRSGWVNLEVARYLAIRSESLRLAVAVLLSRSTVALSALWLAAGVQLAAARETLREFDPTGTEKSGLAWIVACGFVATALIAPDTSFVSCAAFAILAIRATLVPSQWMLTRVKTGTGLEGALVVALAVFQLGSRFWIVDAVRKLLWHTEQALQ